MGVTRGVNYRGTSGSNDFCFYLYAFYCNFFEDCHACSPMDRVAD